METSVPPGNSTPDNPRSLRDLDVRIKSGQAGLVKVLAWMLVLVLIAFVCVSLWFVYRVTEAWEERDQAEARAAEVEDSAVTVVPPRAGGRAVTDPLQMELSAFFSLNYTLQL